MHQAILAFNPGCKCDINLEKGDGVGGGAKTEPRGQGK